MILQKFIDECAPGVRVNADECVIQKYATLLPLHIIELWRRYGFGFYGTNGLQVINPDLYLQNLWGWLGQEENYNRIPIALSAFGTIFYYRKLSGDDHDISYINPHNSFSGVLSWDVGSFFNDLVLNRDVQNELLDAALLSELSTTAEALQVGEIYSFFPALRLGGAKEKAYVKKCDALVQLDFLLQLLTL